jgi:hypothetical protein
MDTSSCIVTEDEYKVIKIENNLDHLNKDIEQVNDEIEQIKRLLFTHQEETPLQEAEEDDEMDYLETMPKELGSPVQKRKLVPAQKLLRKFRTEEELIEYYEMKAVDHRDRSMSNDQIIENDEEDIFEHIEQHNPKQQRGRRDRSDSLKKNIKRYTQMQRNLNDSRENDFEGFEDDIE